MTSELEPIHRELSSLNERLSSITRKPRADLTMGGAQVGKDALVVCGLLGGKDVGKSTLINSLAGSKISIDLEEVGAGTNHPIAYVHRIEVGSIETRLGGIDLKVAVHDRDGLRNVVLLDLPDFDSHISSHEAAVRRIAPLLDRVIWVTTPRKMADREWSKIHRDVIKDAANVAVVFNKLDDLVADDLTSESDGPDDGAEDRAHHFWSQQLDWAGRMLGTAEGKPPNGNRFLIASGFPDKSSFVDRIQRRWNEGDWGPRDRETIEAVAGMHASEFARLRDHVLQPVDPHTAIKIKEANQGAEVAANISKLRSHFDLADRIFALEAACKPGHQNDLVTDAFGREFLDLTTERLMGSRKSDVELAEEVMDVRIDRWPVLPAIYWSLRWLIRRFGQALSIGGGRTAPPAAGVDELFDPLERSISDRIEALVERVRADQAVLVEDYRLDERFPDPPRAAARMDSVLSDLPQDLDRGVVASLTEEYRGGGAITSLFFWATLIWFPIGQPVAEAMLGSASDGGLDIVAALHLIVRSLSATRLLESLAVVVGIFAVILAMMFSRSVRQVRAARGGGQRSGAYQPTDADEISRRIEQSVMVELRERIFEPFQTRFDELLAVGKELTRLEATASRRQS
jgi:hypothetical protein